MPYASDKQRKFFHANEGEGPGKIPSKVVKEFDKASKGKKLPEKSGYKKVQGRWTK